MKLSLLLPTLGRTVINSKKCFGGSVEKYETTTLNFYRGEQLGSSIPTDAELSFERTDHIEAVTDDSIVFSFGSVLKSHIAGLVWEGSSKAGTVRAVYFI